MSRFQKIKSRFALLGAMILLGGSLGTSLPCDVAMAYSASREKSDAGTVASDGPVREVLSGEDDILGAASDKAAFSVPNAFEALTLVNKERKAAGKQLLTMDKKLYNTAKTRAKEIVKKFSHKRPNGSGCFTAFPDTQVSMGENIAEGYFSADKVMGAWLASGEHKATILNDAYTCVGIACYYVPGSKYVYYWVQCFGDNLDTAIFQDGEKITTEAITIYKNVDYGAVFNYSYYLKNHADIAKNYTGDPEGALRHFVTYGMAEGRQGSEEFNVIYYKNRYVDLRNKYGNNLKKYYKHYMNKGKDAGYDGKKACTAIKGSVTRLNNVDYSAVYDYTYYLANNPSVAEKYTGDDIGALTYFVENGMKEGQQAIETFDVMSYAYKYYDLRKKYKNDLPSYYQHYMETGKAQGLVATGVKKMVGGKTEYKGVDYKDVYSVGYYASRYSDVSKAYGLDDASYLKHFVKNGMREGRQGKAAFNVKNYKKRYKDLQKAFGDDLEKYYLHYIKSGKAEGRIGK